MAGSSSPPYMHPSVWQAFENRESHPSHHPHYINPIQAIQSASTAPGPTSVCLLSPFMDVIHEEHRFEVERTAVKTLGTLSAKTGVATAKINRIEYSKNGKIYTIIPSDQEGIVRLMNNQEVNEMFIITKSKGKKRTRRPNEETGSLLKAQKQEKKKYFGKPDYALYFQNPKIIAEVKDMRRKVSRLFEAEGAGDVILNRLTFLCPVCRKTFKMGEGSNIGYLLTHLKERHPVQEISYLIQMYKGEVADQEMKTRAIRFINEALEGIQAKNEPQYCNMELLEAMDNDESLKGPGEVLKELYGKNRDINDFGFKWKF